MKLNTVYFEHILDKDNINFQLGLTRIGKWQMF